MDLQSDITLIRQKEAKAEKLLLRAQENIAEKKTLWEQEMTALRAAMEENVRQEIARMRILSHEEILKNTRLIQTRAQQDISRLQDTARNAREKALLILRKQLEAM